MRATSAMLRTNEGATRSLTNLRFPPIIDPMRDDWRLQTTMSASCPDMAAGSFVRSWAVSRKGDRFISPP